MKHFYFSFLLAHIFLFAQSQDTSIKLSRPQWNKTLNKAFLSILGAKVDNSIIGNYVSLDPVAGAFTFKGSTSIGKEDSIHTSYLSISINGDLISDSYAALFTNFKLNTNAGIQAEWNFRLGKNSFIIDKAQIGQYSHDMGVQEIKMKSSISKNIAEKRLAQNLYSLSRYRKENLSVQLQAKRDSAENVQQIVNSQFSSKLPASFADKKKWTDSMAHISSDLEKLVNDSIALQFKCDSLQLVLADWTNYAYALDAKVLADYKKNTDGLDTTLLLKKIKFTWVTLIAGSGKKNYYTYYDSLPFSSQIVKHDITTWKVGIVWNYYNQSMLSHQALYLNLALIRKQDNNLTLLSTQEINQERAVKNSAGDTTRKITQKYNAYSDTVINYKEVHVPVNFYFLFGKKVSGFHLFPELHIPDHGRTYLNTGLGYVSTFINNKKDQPIINAEAYVQFNDLFNSLSLSSRFWNRNEIGIRFSLPISLLSK